MNSFLYIKSWWLIVLLFLCENSIAQNTNSVYSSYGIGDVYIRDWNAYNSMGGVGVAMKSERTLNDLNPASYSGIKNNRFLLEVAANGTTVHYVSENNDKVATDFNMRRAAVGMNLFKHVTTVFGIRKFSSVNYQTIATRYLQGTNQSLPEIVIGNGGINKAFLSNSFSIGKHLSLGLGTGMLFGSVNKKESINYSVTDGIIVETNNYYNKAFINGGLQYYLKTGKMNWILGGTYQPAINLNNQTTNTITDLSALVLKNLSTTNTTFKFPAQYSGGISVNRGGSTLAFDYIRQNWAATGYSGDGFTSTDLQNFAVGYSYTIFRNSIYGPMEKLTLMAGFQRDLSYLVINNHQVSSMAGSIGFNLPSKNGVFNYTVGIRAGQRGEAIFPLVKEKFVDLTLNVSLGSFFYIGGKKYD